MRRIIIIVVATVIVIAIVTLVRRFSGTGNHLVGGICQLMQLSPDWITNSKELKLAIPTGFHF